MLDMARIVSGKLRLEMQPVDLARRRRSPRSTSIAPSAEAEADRRSARISIRRRRADPGRSASGSSRSIWNLLSNAVKFTEPGGTIEVRRRQRRETERRLVVTRHRSRHQPANSCRSSSSASVRATRRAPGAMAGWGWVSRWSASSSSCMAGGPSLTSEGEGAGRRSPSICRRRCRPMCRFSVAHPRPDTAGDSPSLAGLRVLVVEDEDDSRELLAPCCPGAGPRRPPRRRAGTRWRPSRTRLELPDVIALRPGHGRAGRLRLDTAAARTPGREGRQSPRCGGDGICQPGRPAAGAGRRLFEPRRQADSIRAASRTPLRARRSATKAGSPSGPARARADSGLNVREPGLYSARTRCTNEMAMDPSPTADATRLTCCPARRRPRTRPAGGLEQVRRTAERPAGRGEIVARQVGTGLDEPLASSATHPRSQTAFGTPPVIRNT